MLCKAIENRLNKSIFFKPMDINQNEKFALAYQKMKAAKNILLIGHTAPDADALSSLGIMIELSKSLGIEFLTYTERKPYGAYTYIPNEELISGVSPDDLKNFDVIITLDCGAINRTGLEDRLRRLIKAREEKLIANGPYIIEFDHHNQAENYADLEIRDPECASTTELLYYFFKFNNLEITKEIANCVLIGLLADTGHFLHTNSSSSAMLVASEMLLRGASLPKITAHTTHNKSIVTLKVWGRVLENLKFNSETGLASSALTKAEIDLLLTPEEKEKHADLFSDIASFLSSLSGVSVALLLREEGNFVKGSLRTNLENIDVSNIAKNWGGGGHKKAAGFTVAGKIAPSNNGWKVIF
jgi:phosphoesterase RecJ-like protein